MKSKFYLYNTLTRRKELFEPLAPPFAGMYVCGPTVYSEAHLGHARPAVTFDLLYRYLMHLGYSVRYVRNITDVGHLENETDETGEDKITRKARQEHLEPMEVVQKYMNSFHAAMERLNTLPPSIEPRATGHIIEQQQLIERLIENGYAYEANGSVYFDVDKYDGKYSYGILSGRVLEDMRANSRALEGQDEKRGQFDFALWKKASPGHIMHWPSKWSEGFPGWHLECSVMSTKYLGETFDIHGGGMDLIFPHHECEIAQSTASQGHPPVKYWVHNNMVTINGQKMARSLGNFITLEEMFSGSHKLLLRAYSPMTIRFFMLQAQYRSTLDFSNEALLAASLGLQKLMNAEKTLKGLVPSDISTVDITGISNSCYEAMNDDMNTPVAIAHLFDAVRIINLVNDGKEKLTGEDISSLSELFRIFIHDLFGLKAEESDGNDRLAGVLTLLLDMRQEAKARKEWGVSDRIRDRLSELGITVKDRKEGYDWEITA
ncbi:MAG: cysteine--tRNA ligase [Bacteroidales bacterium]|jgi:cysteinyl-tRNA synthetase|nr:cysteine--tRNA ligase [Bacteroidales bacterium]